MTEEEKVTAQEEQTPEEDLPEEETVPAAEESPADPAEEKGRKAQRRREAELKKKLEDQKAEADAQLAAEKDRYLRLAAEYDNFRRRSQKEKESIYSDGKADTVLKLLPVYDNLERALKAECTDAAFYKGVEMTMTQLTDIFTALGVTPIEAAGQPFNPDVHNAVIHVEDESLGENMVVEEFQKGFMLNDKVIRFAMVKVAN